MSPPGAKPAPDFQGAPTQPDGQGEAQADPRPRPTARPRRAAAPARPKVTTKAIEDALSEMLTLPSAFCALAGDEWAASHFAKSGGELAHHIASVSEHNDVLRRWCERALQGESVGVLVMGLFMYAYPPLLHWGILPGPAELLGVPVVSRKKASPNGDVPTPPRTQHPGVPGSPPPA